MKLSIALGVAAGLIFMSGALASAEPPTGSAEPEDSTVCYWDGNQWLSAYSKTYGQPCTFGADQS